eukprot:scaffold206122_cov13-Tisochrysis_lutea.AAC.1
MHLLQDNCTWQSWAARLREFTATLLPRGHGSSSESSRGAAAQVCSAGGSEREAKQADSGLTRHAQMTSWAH